MEVRRKALSIALSMVSSRNVEEVVGFLKKQLTRTLEQDYEKVCRHGHLTALHAAHGITLECRVSSASHSIYPYMCNQVLRGGCQRRPCTHGVPGRLQQSRRRGCHCLRQVYTSVVLGLFYSDLALGRLLRGSQICENRSRRSCLRLLGR